MPQTDEEWKEAERSFIGSALINLKKLVGQPRSDWDDIDNYANNNAGLILEQISKDIKPDIIVCGGTKDHLRHVFIEMKPHKPEIESVSMGMGSQLYRLTI